MLTPWKQRYNKPRQCIKKQGHHFTDTGPCSQSYGFSHSQVWMWEFDHKESWALKNWCVWTVVLKNTLENPLDCKEIKPVSPKGNQSWILIGRTDAEAETPILWPPVAKNWLIGKEPDAGRDWGQEEKGTTEDEMVGWHHWLDGHEFEQAPGVGDWQRGLACYSPWGCQESDTTERLNWTERAPLPLLPCDDTLEKISICELGSGPSPSTGSACTFVLELSASRTVTKAFLLFKRQTPRYFYSSPNVLRYRQFQDFHETTVFLKAIFEFHTVIGKRISCWLKISIFSHFVNYKNGHCHIPKQHHYLFKSDKIDFSKENFAPSTMFL